MRRVALTCLTEAISLRDPPDRRTESQEAHYCWVRTMGIRGKSGLSTDAGVRLRIQLSESETETVQRAAGSWWEKTVEAGKLRSTRTNAGNGNQLDLFPEHRVSAAFPRLRSLQLLEYLYSTDIRSLEYSVYVLRTREGCIVRT
jgi:hypothetical protein